MRKEAHILSAITAALIAFTSFKAEVTPLAIAAIACGVAWSVLVASQSTLVSLSILLALQTAIAVINLFYGAPVYLIGLAIVLLIMSWDWALTKREIAGVSSENEKHFCIHHCVQTVIILGLAFGLLVIPLEIQISIGFRSALGLSMGAFMLIALLLKLLARRN